MNNMISVFPNFSTTDSIFQKMVLLGAPWTTDVGLSMDVAYFTMYSGLKTPSSFVSIHMSSLGVPNSTQISKYLWDIFGRNWEKLWNGYIVKYNPIENYNLLENIVRDRTDNRTIDKEGTFSGATEEKEVSSSNSTGQNKLTHGHVVSDTRTINDFNFGFNSDTSVPTATQTQEGTQTNSGADTTDTIDDSTTTVDGTGTQEQSSTDSTKDDNITNEKISTERSGNIGQRSTQELLTQEFELWKWNFFWEVFSDVDKFLCLSVFDTCSSVN